MTLLVKYILMLSFVFKSIRIHSLSMNVNKMSKSYPLHYSNLPEETLYLLDATSLLFTAHYSREVAEYYSTSKAKFESSQEVLPCGALLGVTLYILS